MKEYFIQANSFAAPLFSDSISRHVEAETPDEALRSFVASEPHPCGVYAAACYASADAMHKGEGALARWLSNHAARLGEVTKELGACSVLVSAPGRFRVNDDFYTVDDPKGGRVVGV